MFRRVWGRILGRGRRGLARGRGGKDKSLVPPEETAAFRGEAPWLSNAEWEAFQAGHAEIVGGGDAKRGMKAEVTTIGGPISPGLVLEALRYADHPMDVRSVLERQRDVVSLEELSIAASRIARGGRAWQDARALQCIESQVRRLMTRGLDGEEHLERLIRSLGRIGKDGGGEEKMVDRCLEMLVRKLKGDKDMLWGVQTMASMLWAVCQQKSTMSASFTRELVDFICDRVVEDEGFLEELGASPILGGNIVWGFAELNQRRSTELKLLCQSLAPNLYRAPPHVSASLLQSLHRLRFTHSHLQSQAIKMLTTHPDTLQSLTHPQQLTLVHICAAQPNLGTHLGRIMLPAILQWKHPHPLDLTAALKAFGPGIPIEAQQKMATNILHLAKTHPKRTKTRIITSLATALHSIRLRFPS